MFQKKTAVITGAAVGIGKATAILMAQQGANVVLVDVNQEKLEALAVELVDYAQRIMICVCDVRDEAAVYKVVAQANARFGGVDILVNNAALWRCWSSFANTSTDEWKRFFDVNVFGTVFFTKAVIGQMTEKGYGRIINVASVAGVYGNANMVHYSATKGAIISLTKALAKEVADKGVTVNAVSPGSVSPSENGDIDFFRPSELSFMGRTGTDRENAELICFLASDKASYISGQSIQIDGCRKKM